MSHTQQVVTGGQFLTTDVGPSDVFTREDVSDDQRLFGRAASEFMRGEVIPREARLYAHDWDLTRDHVLAGVHLASRRRVSKDRPRARHGRLHARPAHRRRPGERDRRVDRAGVGLARGVLPRGSTWTAVCRGGAADERAGAGPGRSSARR